MQQAEIGQLLNAEAVRNIFGWKSDSTLYEAMRLRGFPRPIKISTKCARWSLPDIRQWIEQRRQEAA